MKVLEMNPTQEIPTEPYKITKELPNGYEIEYFKEYSYNNNDTLCISLKLFVSVDELYYLQSKVDENINKFKDRLGESLGQYIRRYLL